MARRHGTSDPRHPRPPRLAAPPNRLEFGKPPRTPLHSNNAQTRQDTVHGSNDLVPSGGRLESGTSPVHTSYHYQETGAPVEMSHTPLRGAARHLSPLPSTPTNEANTGRRRVNYSSILSHSPARPGHCSRMKQFFEQVGKSDTTSFDLGRVRYPQLPNSSGPLFPDVSERLHPLNLPITASHSPKLNVTSPQVLSAQPVTKLTSITSTTLYGKSSESWSDDSGYINAESLTHKSTETARCRVRDWLSAVSEGNDDTETKPRPSSQPSSLNSDYLESHTNFSDMPDTTHAHEVSLPFSQEDCVSADPFLSCADGNDTNIADTCEDAQPYCVPPMTSKGLYISDPCKHPDLSTATEAKSRPVAKSCLERHTGLSLLSPNVCIERGTPQQQPLKSSSRQETSAIAAYGRYKNSKENLAAEAETLYSSSMWQDLSPTVYTRTRSAKYLQHGDGC